MMIWFGLEKIELLRDFLRNLKVLEPILKDTSKHINLTELKRGLKYWNWQLETSHRKWRLLPIINNFLVIQIAKEKSFPTNWQVEGSLNIHRSWLLMKIGKNYYGILLLSYSSLQLREKYSYLPCNSTFFCFVANWWVLTTPSHSNFV